MKHFIDIINDNRSGSVQIVNNLIKEIRILLQQPEPPDAAFINDLKEVLYHHRGMLVLFHFINEFFQKIDEDFSGEQLLEFLNQYENKWNDVNKEIVKNVLRKNEFNRKRILLHSNSSTVLELFKEFYIKDIHPEVYQTVSYPIEEGKLQAEEISNTGIQVNVIADGAAAEIIQDIDYFICGADAILKDTFVNRSGTFLYALACENFNKEFFILTDSRKIINEEYLPIKLRKIYTEFTDNSPSEIWDDPPENIKIINRYFEKIPLKLADKIYTETEILLPADLSNKSLSSQISAHLL
jgi:translation initiation factor 2B subunit (eIF-2B alpha/beta/delta family)